jgi:hypothetical protein
MLPRALVFPTLTIAPGGLRSGAAQDSGGHDGRYDADDQEQQEYDYCGTQGSTSFPTFPSLEVEPTGVLGTPADSDRGEVFCLR